MDHHPELTHRKYNIILRSPFAEIIAAGGFLQKHIPQTRCASFSFAKF